MTALSTDGGGIPRNFLLSHGLSLVRFEAWTLLDFVQKCCWAPARMIGLLKKGHLSPGADGDLVVADPHSHDALLTVAGGKIIMVNGLITGSGGTIITTGRGGWAMAQLRKYESSRAKALPGSRGRVWAYVVPCTES